MAKPRILIAGANSGSGKTTFSLGIMAALKRRGLDVRPFKCGPDYIDPAWHTLACQTEGRNLDIWMTGKDSVSYLFARNAAGGDISVIEGVMGLFDGFDGQAEQGSTAELAQLLDVPIVLVINAQGMSASAAAIALGFRDYDPQVKIAGFLLSNVGSEKHYGWLKTAIEARTGLPVLGCLYRDKALVLPERHLGLITAAESGNMDGFFSHLADAVEADVDLDMLLELARGAEELPAVKRENVFPCDVDQAIKQQSFTGARIGLAYDRAFSFIYRDNIDLLEDMGAEIIRFSLLDGNRLPEGISGLIIPGGYPEVYAAELSANISMRSAVCDAARSSMPVYGECGGFMYLTQGIATPGDGVDGNCWPLCGLIPGRVMMHKKLQSLGYRAAVACSDNILAVAGQRLRGHEFHYSTYDSAGPETKDAFISSRRGAQKGELAGWSEGALLASYLHLHFYSDTRTAQRFLAACKRWQDLNHTAGKGRS